MENKEIIPLLKKLLREKKLVPNCSYHPDFYFCIGITGTSENDIPDSFKNCRGCQLGKFIFGLSLVPEVMPEKKES